MNASRYNRRFGESSLKRVERANSLDGEKRGTFRDASAARASLFSSVLGSVDVKNRGKRKTREK